MKISDAITQTFTLLADRGVAEPRSEAALLVGLAAGRDKPFLIAHPEYELTTAEQDRLANFAHRRANHEPFQYISGKQEFFGLEFDVSPDVLIPRPETETLVEKAIEILARIETPVLCDVGVGSGCIAVSILTNVDRAVALGLDKSPQALALAAHNAAKHQVSDRMRLLESDVFSSLRDEKFDTIVSNPPYVPLADMRTLQPEVRDFEPVGALTDGGDGLSIVRALVDRSSQFLRPGGNLFVEIGFGQSDRVAKMFDPEKWFSFEFLPDLQGIPRIAHARSSG